VSFGPRLPRDPPKDPATITETAVKLTRLGNSTGCRHNKVIPGVRFMRKSSRLSRAYRSVPTLSCYMNQRNNLQPNKQVVSSTACRRKEIIPGVLFMKRLSRLS
jgi:hypothetical protein